MSKIGVAITRALERWVRSARAARWPPQSKANRRAKSYHLWAIIALMALVALAYYVEFTPLVNVPLVERVLAYPGGLLRPMFLRTIFFTLVVYASFVFRVQGSLIASLAFLCLVLPRAFLPPFTAYSDPVIRPFVFVFIAGYVGLLVAAGLNRIDREHANLEHFLADTMNTQEKEKQHLARELHDGSLQALVDISHDIDELSEAEDRANTKSGLKQLRDKVDAVLAGIRQSILGLRPPLLEEIGLESSLKWLAHEIAQEGGVEVNVEVRGEARRLTDKVELSLFRIAQEALQNAKKHSQATRIRLTLAFVGDKAQLTVQDNGVGFAVPAQEKLATQMKFGLIGMAERARLLGGSLRVQSLPGNGTVIFAEVPIRRAEPSQQTTR